MEMEEHQLELLKRYDRDAWERWDREIRPRLRLFFIGLRATRSEVYDDLTQETLRKVARRISTFRDGDHLYFEAWVYRTARRTYLDWVRSSVRSRETGLVNEGQEPSVDPDLRSLEDGFDTRDLNPALHWALSRLSPRQRAFFIDRHVHGLEPRRIAIREGCAPGTVYQTLAEAKKKLRDLLAARKGKPSIR
jgi:RNA polymerase sigma factor (sigma-70 family)